MRKNKSVRLNPSALFSSPSSPPPSPRSDKPTWLAVLTYLCASFPDFNVDYKGVAILEPDGFYHIPNEQHNGKFTGVPFSPPGSTLPKLQPTGQFFSTAAFEGRVLVDKATCLVSECEFVRVKNVQ